MTYALGAVGAGHWFNRLYAGIKSSNRIRIAKIAGVSSLEQKKDKLRDMGLDDDSYYRIGSDSLIPDAFFNNIDVVHLSDPNQYHSAQTIEVLKHGKIVVTEKTWGVTKAEFDMVAKFIRENKLQDKAYLHLHYIQKQLTYALPELLRIYTAKYGKVTKVAATLFELTNEEDARRKDWLFDMSSGGLFMDVGIHMVEIIIAGAKAESVRLEGIKNFLVNPDYNTKNPTGVEALVSIKGELFAEGATGAIRVSKGATEAVRSARFFFGPDVYLDLEYLSSGAEYSSENRGTWELFEKGALKDSGFPKGPNNSEVFANHIVHLCDGKNIGLNMSEADALFETQWTYQEMIKTAPLISSAFEVQSFMSRGILLE